MTFGSSGRIGRLALFAALCGALALGACGRKGGLDAPPTAYSDPNAGTEVEEPESSANVLHEGSGSSLPIIRGPKKRIPLDALLN